MSKVPYHNCEEFDSERLAEFFAAPENAALKHINVTRLMACAGDALIPFCELSNTLRYQGVLDPLVREMAIYRIGTLANSRYELHYHEAMFKAHGGTDEKIAAISEGPTAKGLNEFERHLLSFVDSIAEKFKPDNEDFAYLRNELSMQALHELVLNIGFYLMSCAYMETFEVELESPEQLNEIARLTSGS